MAWRGAGRSVVERAVSASASEEELPQNEIHGPAPRVPLTLRVTITNEPLCGAAVHPRELTSRMCDPEGRGQPPPSAPRCFGLSEGRRRFSWRLEAAGFNDTILMKGKEMI